MALSTIYQGDTKTITVTITSNGDVFDISGCTIYFTMKASAADSDADAVVKKTITNHTQSDQGISIFTLSTKNIVAGTYVYDIRFKDTTGKVSTIDNGNLVIATSITQSIS